MNSMSVVVTTGAKTGLPTPTRREYVPVGSIPASMPSTVGLEQAGFHLMQTRTSYFLNPVCHR